MHSHALLINSFSYGSVLTSPAGYQYMLDVLSTSYLATLKLLKYKIHTHTGRPMCACV